MGVFFLFFVFLLSQACLYVQVSAHTHTLSHPVHPPPVSGFVGSISRILQGQIIAEPVQLLCFILYQLKCPQIVEVLRVAEKKN